MGLEVVCKLVHAPTFDEICSMSWEDVYASLESTELRKLRPKQDERLERKFDIDAEAELLDWMDSFDHKILDRTNSFLDCLSGVNDSTDGLLLISEWCSVGAWEVWEARAILYFENATGERVENSNDLISLDTWTQVFESLNGMNESEFSEKVCMDWMQRRLDLGETLDETKDPRIAPTFEAHSRNSKTLVHAVNVLENNTELKPLFGREYLPAFQWHYGLKTLGMISNE